MAKKLRDWVTLKEIEAAGPCVEGYVRFLFAIKSNADPKGKYRPGTDKVYFDGYNGKFPAFPSPRYSPTDKIPLKVIAKLPSAKDNKYWKGETYLAWILEEVEVFTTLLDNMQEYHKDKLSKLRDVLEKQISKLEAELDKLYKERVVYSPNDDFCNQLGLPLV